MCHCELVWSVCCVLCLVLYFAYRNVMRCDVITYDVVWCGVVWCTAVWCSVLLCGVVYY